MNIATLSILFNVKGADDAQNKIDKLKKATTDLASTFSAFKKVFNQISNFAKGGEELGLLAESAGLSAEKIGAYGQALQIMVAICPPLPPPLKV